MKNRLSLQIIGSLFIIVAGIFLSGSYLAASSNHPLGEPPKDLQAKAVEFSAVKGWLVPSETATGKCVLLMHGVRSDRTSMIERARFFKKIGYTSLLFDFQAHGESQGSQITFGYLESANAHEALDFLKSTGQCEKVAAIGQSLGGAAALLGAEPLKVNALVLESVYPSIQDAIADRLEIKLGVLGRYMAPLLYVQIPLRTGISITQLQPELAIKHVKCPIFIISGSLDMHTRVAEAMRLFANSPSPKQFWEVPGAAHQDIYSFAKVDYEKNIQSFLSTYM